MINCVLISKGFKHEIDFVIDKSCPCQLVVEVRPVDFGSHDTYGKLTLSCIVFFFFLVCIEFIFFRISHSNKNLYVILSKCFVCRKLEWGIEISLFF